MKRRLPVAILNSKDFPLQFSLHSETSGKKEGLLWSDQPFAFQLLELVAGVRFELTTFGLCDLTQLSLRVGLYLHPV